MTRPAAYQAVLRDLQKLRNDIDATIAVLRRVANGEIDLARIVSRAANLPVGELPGTPLKDALISVLRRSKRPMTNAEILARLKAEHVEFRSRDPAVAVAQALGRMVKTRGPVVKVGRGRWSARAVKRSS